MDRQTMRECRVLKDTTSRDGYILRATEDGKVGFINPSQVSLVSAGQVWLCTILDENARYFKARLVEAVHQTRRDVQHYPHSNHNV